MNASNFDSFLSVVEQEHGATDKQTENRQEVRCAVRFPLTLPVVLETAGEELAGETRNISASGVLIELDRELSAGMEIDFSLRMPGAILGNPHDILVHCRGRVVRCSISKNQILAAATIDDYQFVER